MAIHALAPPSAGASSRQSGEFVSTTPPSHIRDGRDALPPIQGRRSVAFERMWHILHSIDECAAKHGDNCLQPVKDLELIQVENRFLWSTGTLFNWRDPGMAALVVEWVKGLIRRGEMSKEEGRLLAEHIRSRTKPLLERMDQAAREQGLKKFEQAGLEEAEQDRPFTPARPEGRPETIAAPEALAPEPKKTRPAPDYESLLAKLKKQAEEEIASRGLRLSLPRAAAALLARPDLPQEVEAGLSNIYLDVQGLDLTAEAADRPPHILYMQVLARRCKLPSNLAPGTQEALWKLRTEAKKNGSEQIMQYAERLVFSQNQHPEALTVEIIDTCLAEDRNDCLTVFLKRRRPGLPERTLQRIAVLTTNQEALLALSRRSDLTRKVLQKILKKPLWRAQPGAKAAVSESLKANPTAMALMSVKGRKSRQAA